MPTQQPAPRRIYFAATALCVTLLCLVATASAFAAHPSTAHAQPDVPDVVTDPAAYQSLLSAEWGGQCAADDVACSTRMVIPSEISLTGQISGANYLIRMPNDWQNGTLVLYAHGYRDKADQPGQVDNTEAEAAPLGKGTEDALVAAGYAIAGSAWSDNGWAVEQGIADTLALTQFFSETIGAPARTILLGSSLGSMVAFKSIETHADVYDAAIGVCGLGAGSTQTWDGALAIALAYDITFGWPADWGTVGDVRDDLNFEEEVLPTLLRQLARIRENYGKFEFIRLVSDLPEEGFYTEAGKGTPWLLAAMYYITEARAELERRAGGPPVQNLNHIYSLSDDEKAYLVSLGVDPNALLGAMNTRRTISADPAARAYLAAYANYTGAISRPVLTMHTVADGVNPVSHETVYRQSVAAAGRSALLVQSFVDAVGHCQFTTEQILIMVNAMNRWLETGTPTSPDTFSSAAGYLPNYQSPPWPIAFIEQQYYLPFGPR